MLLLIGHTKGGVGKSTIAINLAVKAAHDGNRVVLIDCDRQQTAAKWSTLRIENGVEPDVRVHCMTIDGDTSFSAFSKALLALRAKFDLVVIDCQGRDSRELRACMGLTDVMLVPTPTSHQNLHSLSDVDDAVAQVNQVRAANPLRPYVVLNSVPTINVEQATEAAFAAIAEMEEMVSGECGITSRDRFNTAYREGKGVADYVLDDLPKQVRDSVEKAQREVDRVYELAMNGLDGVRRLAVAEASALGGDV